MGETLFELDPPLVRGARISECGLYRYDLFRSWSYGDPVVCWLLLNPSKADATREDNTLDKIIRYSKAWGYGGLYVVNMYAYRATKPKEMWDANRKKVDIVGPENDATIKAVVVGSALLVCGWGNNGIPGTGENTVRGRRNNDVMKIIRSAGKTPHALMITSEGQPAHPLYLKGDLRPVPMEVSR